VSFHVETPPYFLGRQCCFLRPMSKPSLRRALRKAHPCSLPLDAESLCDLTIVPGIAAPSVSSMESWAQGMISEPPCQVVKRPRWWRREKRRSVSPDRTSASHARKQKFKELMTGCCFNCLGKDHRRVHCRDLPKCWRCKRSGHISLRCKRLSVETSLPKLTHSEQKPRLHLESHLHPSSSSSPPPTPPLQGHKHSGVIMERRRFHGEGVLLPGQGERWPDPRGCAVNYLDNPRFCPRAAVKIMHTFEEMEHRRVLLTSHGVLITEEGPMEVQSREEVKDIISLHSALGSMSFKSTEVIQSLLLPFSLKAELEM
jgi:hypothetical protein